MRTIVITAIALLILGVHAVSQTPQFVASPDFPEGEGAWTMHITSTGGLTGQDRGSLSITSLGTRTCQLLTIACSSPLSDEKILPLKQFAAAFDSSKWATPTPSTMILCSDCYITTVNFTRREGGVVKSHLFTWTIANQSSAPPDLVRIAETALSGNW